MGAPPFSPALRFKQRQQADRARAAFYEALKESQAPKLDPSATDYSEFEQLKFSLEKDVQWLKEKGKGDEKRSAIKDTLIPRYQPHLESYLKQVEIYANPILVQRVIWAVDVGDIHATYKYGMLAVDQQQQMPNYFKRDLPTFLTDSLRELAQEANTPVEKEQAFYYLLKAVTAVRQWPLTDTPKMKYLAALGDLFEEQGGPENELKALALYKEAHQYGNAKRKTQINKLTKLHGSPPTEGTLVSMMEDRGLPGQDNQGSPSTSNDEEATVNNKNEAAEESR